MDTTAIYKLSYGVFFLGTEFEGKKNICVINTTVQQTAEPLIISITVLKTNYTADLILKSKKFSIGIIGQNATLEDIAHFGQQSGRDVDKLSSKNYTTDIFNNPLYLKGCIASLSAKVIDVIELPTHYLFIAKVEDAKNISDENPLTYAQYRQLKAGGSISDDTTKSAKTWQCSICHYVYDGDTPFEDLPDDYVCPVCGRPKKFFEQV